MRGTRAGRETRRASSRAHVQKRGAVFYYRRRLPMELAGARDGAGPEIVRLLRTSAYRRACAAATLIDARVERFLQALRRARRVASEETIRRLCERFYAEVLSSSREERRKWRAQGWDDDLSPAEEAFEAAGVGDELADDEAERMAVYGATCSAKAGGSSVG